MNTTLIRGLHNVLPQHRGGVVTIGNFDGVHLGHQVLLAKVQALAQAQQVASMVVTFEPQPLEYFAKTKTALPPRLTNKREKFLALARYGIDQVLYLRFNAWLAQLSADEFVQEILVKALGIRAVVIGDDFHFGRGRSGDEVLLRKLGQQYGFAVITMPTFSLAGERVSSTRVRTALQQADHELVKKLLGRPYEMYGRVVHGDKQGRALGFPTANIFLHRAATAVQGIYVVRMHDVDQQPIPGAANVGTRPTVGGTRSLLEVHLLDFNRDIYGKHVRVEFCCKLREEEKFPNLEILKQYIAQDVQQAREYFAKNPLSHAVGEG